MPISFGERKKTSHPIAGRIVLVGNPNVGKSVLFGRLTGRYVTVSNYPGTTVEVTRGAAYFGGRKYEVIDTPGMHTLFPMQEDEKIARQLLTASSVTALHVLEAKKLERLLPVTLELIQAGVPTVLVLNMLDEAEREGLRFDTAALEKNLGIPVVAVSGTTGYGLDMLRERLEGFVSKPHRPRPAADPSLERLRRFLDIAEEPAAGLKALLLLHGDEEEKSRFERERPELWPQLKELLARVETQGQEPLEYRSAMNHRLQARRLAASAVSHGDRYYDWRASIDGFLMHPFTGFLALGLVLYFALYRFVAVFGAGTVVNFLEKNVFEGRLNPFFTRLFSEWIPNTALRELFVGDYGMITLGLRYAVSLILPIVTFYFMVFSVIEDTGYLPRLAMLLDRVFKRVGLSGRAVIPMVLGLGCVTMATLVTRTLATKRERLIATFLLALAVPCSAQLGVILAVFAGRPALLASWAAIIGTIFLGAGLAAAKLFPGERPLFYMELPPLRRPSFVNIAMKTFMRVKWYFLEVLPLFLLASVLIWAGRLTGVFDFVVRLLEIPVRFMGLPAQTASVFLFGFFRRDYGVAGLYDLNKSHLLNDAQLLVACVALTLFLPCVAQFVMTVRERGWRTGLAVSAFVFFFSFAVACVLSLVLSRIGGVA